MLLLLSHCRDNELN